MLEKYLDAFAESDEDIGKVQDIEHRIETGEAPPARAKARFYSPTQRKAIADEVEALQKGWYRAAFEKPLGISRT